MAPPGACVTVQAGAGFHPKAGSVQSDWERARLVVLFDGW